MMAAITPYTYIQCPCSDPSAVSRHHTSDASSPTQAELDLEDDEQAFDPRAPRSSYSLYPLEYLLYCEDCHQIRCPRCIAEEIVTYYCPSCLFEVPGSNIKSDGNRCTRSCFQCPICIGPLAVTPLEHPRLDPETLTEFPAPLVQSSFILSCSYCNWTSTEARLVFEKPNGIYGQLHKLRNGGKPRLTPKERKDRRKNGTTGGTSGSAGSSLAGSALPPIGEEAPAKEVVRNGDMDVETQFANLKAFYQNQLSETSSSSSSGLTSLGDLGLGIGSPGSLSRIMSLYTGTGVAPPKSKRPLRSMREAVDPDEGFRPAELDEAAAIAQLNGLSYPETVSADQAAHQPPNLVEADPHGRVRFSSSLRPIPHLLRTKRSKRCPVCRHIISKPESKVSSMRFRIRLVAGSYIPSISIRPMQATSLTSPNSSAPRASILGMISSSLTPGHGSLLAPLRPVQYLLTFRNPLFEPIKITLATPSVTPGRFASKVTILCPEFSIDANTDVWDEALKDGDGSNKRNSRRAGGGDDGVSQQQANQAEAGKVWERGRNWVSIVVEVVPASLKLEADNPSLVAVSAAETGGDGEGRSGGEGGEKKDLGPLRENEDILEIPILIRMEWETDATHDEVGIGAGPAKGDKEGREKHELAYWCALGIGRISQDW